MLPDMEVSLMLDIIVSERLRVDGELTKDKGIILNRGDRNGKN